MTGPIQITGGIREDAAREALPTSGLSCCGTTGVEHKPWCMLAPRVMCDLTWKADGLRGPDPEVYRQHRCKRTDKHERGACTCRYCGQKRGWA